MYVKRVTVEEGFLHGLNLKMEPGLVVLVGPRGSGKTSIIELIRFCLDVPPYASSQVEISRRQVTAVLGSGRVTVTVDDDGEEVTFARAVNEDEPRVSTTRSIKKPIILSQSEIEQVGRFPDSRLRLLDGFAPSLGRSQRSEDAARALVSSLTVELRTIATDNAAIDDELRRLAEVPQQLEVARAQAAAASASLEGAQTERLRLEQLNRELAAAAVRSQAYERAAGVVQARIRTAVMIRGGAQLDAWPTAAQSDDLLMSVRENLDEASTSFEHGIELLERARQRLEELQSVETGRMVALEDDARTMRSHIDRLSEGAGALMKRVSDLETSVGRMGALGQRRAEQQQRWQDIRGRRNQEMDRLEELREARVNSREEAAAYLNSKLAPRIRVTVNRFGSLERYCEALAEGLRGSGLQFNVLAQQLAAKLSPRELAEAAETGDAGAIAELAGISVDRAHRVAAHLSQSGTENIIIAPLEDTVDLALLDGGKYKPADELSVGQRCTTVLPLILSHTERAVIVDQPEDNLDNSYIADTLVQALRNRSRDSQFILATHNPNVPVLGDADLVISLISDGKRGEIEHAADLQDARIVHAITDVMEGGLEAFRVRAEFYARGSA